MLPIVRVVRFDNPRPASPIELDPLVESNNDQSYSADIEAEIEAVLDDPFRWNDDRDRQRSRSFLLEDWSRLPTATLRNFGNIHLTRRQLRSMVIALFYAGNFHRTRHRNLKPRRYTISFDTGASLDRAKHYEWEEKVTTSIQQRRLTCPIYLHKDITVVTLCSHAYCKECLEEWKLFNSRYPSCRALMKGDHPIFLY